LQDVAVPGWEDPASAAAWVRALRQADQAPANSGTTVPGRGSPVPPPTSWWRPWRWRREPRSWPATCASIRSPVCRVCPRLRQRSH